MILAIDQGTTGTTCLVFDPDGAAGRPRLPRVHPALPDARAGSSTTPRRSGRSRRRWPARRSTDAGVAPRRARRGRDHQPARDGRASGIRRPGEPLHRALVWQDRRTAGRCEELRAAGHEELVRDAHRARARPVLLGDQDRVAAGERRRPARAGPGRPRGVRDDRRVDRLQPDRRARHRPVERLADAALRHRAAAPGTPSCSSCFGVPERALPEVRPSAGSRRHDARRTRCTATRSPVCGRRGRPAGGALRPGLPRRRDGQEHLRDRVVRAASTPADARRRRRAACSTTVAWGIGDRARLRARGGDLRHRRRGPVAARRPRHDRRGRRDRGAGRLARVQRRRLLRAGADRARLAALGPGRARDDRRAHPRAPAGRIWRGRRSRRSPTRRSTPSARSRRPAARRADRAAGRRRRERQRLADAVPGRRPRRAGGRAGAGRDDGARRGVAGGGRGRAVDAGSGPHRLARAAPATSRRWPTAERDELLAGWHAALARSRS